MTTRFRAGRDIESGALVLIGNEASFRWLAQLLRAPRTAIIEIQKLERRPLLRPVGALQVERGEGAVTISFADDAATIRGAAESCARLADEIELFLEHNDLDEPGMHSHIDASTYSTSDLLAPDSAGLLLAGPVPDEEG